MLAHSQKRNGANREFTLIKQSTEVCLKAQTLGFWYVTKLHYAAIIWMCSPGTIPMLVNDRSKPNLIHLLSCATVFLHFWGLDSCEFLI